MTVADLLSHRAGLAWTDGTLSFDEALAWDPVIEALERQAPSWPPGTAHGYHATTLRLAGGGGGAPGQRP